MFIQLSAFLLMTTCAGAQNKVGAAYRLYTDPMTQASGRANFGLGAIVGIYDRYLCDFGFHLSGNYQKSLVPNKGARGEPIQRMDRTIHAGIQVFPFGLHDRIMFERRAHNERQRFHHRRKMDERIHRCPNSCFGRRDPNLDKWLKGFYLGCAYEFGNVKENYPGESLNLVTHQHGVQIDVGYAMTIEFLSLSLNWAPLGLVSRPVSQNQGQDFSPRSVHNEDIKYRPDLTFSIGIALFN